MAKTNFQSAARELKALNQALRAVAEHTKNVSRELVGGLESAVLSEIDVFQKDVQRRLDDSTAKVQGLANFLNELGPGGAPRAGKKGPGRPKGSGGKRKKGKRGVRVELSREELEAAMAKAEQVKTRAADLLGVSVPTLNKKLAEAGLVSAGGRRGRKPGPKKGAAKKKAGAAKKKATAKRGPGRPKKKAAKKSARKKSAKK